MEFDPGATLRRSVLRRAGNLRRWVSALAAYVAGIRTAAPTPGHESMSRAALERNTRRRMLGILTIVALAILLALLWASAGS